VFSQLFDQESEDDSKGEKNAEGGDEEEEGEEAEGSGGGGDGVHSANARLANAAKRNAIRRQLDGAFESIQVWLMPPPTEKTKDLKKILTDDLLSEEFKEAVKSLRGVLCKQCSAPRLWSAQELTGPKVARLIPKVVETLNKNELILPSSAYEAMVRERVCLCLFVLT
jgi:hypothetical protein